MLVNTAISSKKIDNKATSNTSSAADIGFYEGSLEYFPVPAPPDDNGGLEQDCLTGFTAMKEAYVPSAITKIPNGFFNGCTALEKVTCARNTKSFKKNAASWGTPATCQKIYDTKAVSKWASGSQDDDTGYHPVDVSAYDSTKFAAPAEGYRVAMYELLKSIKDYAIHRNYPGFSIIANGGIGIFMEDESKGWTKDKIKKLAGVVDAVAIEDYYYGSDADYNQTDDKPSPQSVRDDFAPGVDGAKEAGEAVWIIDYCSTPANIQDSQKKCAEGGFQASYQARNRELNYTPLEAMPNQTKNACYGIKSVKNFMALLNPNPDANGQFKDKEDYITQLVNCDADALIIDLYYDSKVITAEDVERLKHKSNGARRMVYCYSSTGEAENYRLYWNVDWETVKPDWIGAVNKNWAGNFKVKYWTEPWKNILIGSRNSYVDIIISLGFDGIFADVIDAYEYFENLKS